MKNHSEMKFGSYTFMHNPKKLTVTSELGGNETILPFCGCEFTPVALENAVIRGEGVITGEDRFKRVLQLSQCLNRGQALLTLPPFPSVRAVLTRLEYSLEPGDGVVGISFEFKSSSYDTGLGKMEVASVVADGDESLWDIAWRYNKPVESLLKLNPRVKRPDIVEKGWVIRLC